MKKKPKNKPDFGKHHPPKECGLCGGRGEVKDEYVSSFLSGYWEYKKCPSCLGDGKNHFHCMSCDSLLNYLRGELWCSNRKCKKFNCLVALGRKDI